MPSSTGFKLDISLLDQAIRKAAKEGVKAKVILLASPNNPLGRVHTRDELESILQYASDKDLHLVFDEVYALSVFGPQAQFVSVGELVSEERMSNRIHIIYGFSKDFGVSGFRVGVLYSANKYVIHSVGAYCGLMASSSDTQFVLRTLLEDEEYLEHFLSTNQRRLEQSYALLARELKENGVPFLPTDSGIFTMIDLRGYLSSQTFEAEDELWRILLDKANLNMSPGSAMKCTEPGWFRCCWASVSFETLRVALQRMTRVLKDIPRVS